MNRITVFCASSPGFDPIYFKNAQILGQTLAKRGIGLVYGGAKVGLMGAVADGVLKNDGEAIGVLPYFLNTKEVAHDNLTQLIMVDTMHERKTKMHELSDGVIALPGGFGTLEELFEMLTWGQLGLHQKPIGLYNMNGFYNPLIALLDEMVDKGFLKPNHHGMLLVADNAAELLDKMSSYDPPQVTKWLHKKNT